MNILKRLRRVFERLLEAVTVLQMAALAIVVIVAVIYRWAGESLSWYDEVASIQLAWLTYYGSALAALKRSHIGVTAVLNAVRPQLRVVLFLIGEVIVIGFFVTLGWIGYMVLGVLAGDTLVSLPEVSVQFTQSVIPISSVLFIVAQLMSFPEEFAKAKSEHAEMSATDKG
ncbi:MAG: TRAP transporter small permease subunit [Rhodospirillales bacterium]